MSNTQKCAFPMQAIMRCVISMPRGRNGTMQDVIIHKGSEFNVIMFLG